MGFNRRKMEDRRREAAEKEAATRRATGAQVRLLVPMGALSSLPIDQQH
jgi:hypothetical protein